MTTEVREYEIDGMTCAACVSRVERVLKRVPGVEDAVVNLATHRATVGASAELDPAAIVAAVDAAGYTARPRAAEDPLEPRVLTAASGQRVPLELQRVIAAAAITAPLMALSMVHALHFPGSAYVQGAMALAVVFGAGLPVLQAAWKNALRREVTMDTLVAIGSLAALAHATARAAREGAHAMHLEFETAAMIVTLVLLGRALEARARRRTGDAVRALVALRPPIAHVLREGAEADVPVSLVRVGARLRVRAHERVPVDGVVRAGDAWIDASMLTGESDPVARAPGDEVSAGTLNGDAPFEMEATRVGGDTQLARIVRLVESAQGSKAPAQRLADRVAAVFVPVVMGVAAVAFAAWWLSGAGFDVAAMRAVSVLVVACPCALGLATPTAIVVGTGAAAQEGVLLRDAATLERLAAVDVVVFDKTGTLTEGRPSLVALRAEGARGEDALLGIAAAVERGATHPFARAVVEAAAARGVEVPEARDVRARAGEGVTGVVDGRAVRVGAARREGDEVAAWRAKAWSVATVDVDGEEAGALAVADALRPSAAEAVKRLQERGIDVRMLSGDHARTARSVASRVGIADEKVSAEVSPEGKREAVRALREAGRVVAMVGDGVNDAPALAEADVGVAMGGGADVASEAAAATLVRADPRRVATAIDAARATMRTVRQNLAWAFGYNLVGVPLAALGALDRIGGPATAAAAMAFSSIAVVTNALYLRTRIRRR